MWEMLEPDLECGNECWGPGPPPEFLIPPPPRPPFLQELTSKCTEDPLPDIEMCEAIPILDASYRSSPSLQTSAMIAVSSVLLVLVVLLSSLFAWKHKRKVQNFLPCKTPTRGGHLNATSVSGGHSVTYEDPDAHLGRRPLVMRHHNMEMLHAKSIHFPSGYPMTRSPPLFVCSSPGPDPYRSNDNVYEELGPPRDSDAESEPPLHSDDDFAEDELSLPGDRSFHKLTNSTDTQPATVATIYHERSNGTTNNCSNAGSLLLERSTNERNSLLSSSSSNNDRTSNGGSSGGGGGGVISGILRTHVSPDSGLFRSRKIHNSRTTKMRNYSADELNTSSDHNSSIVDPVTTLYDDRNLMTLPYSHNHSNSINNNNNNINNSISNSNNINNNNNNNNHSSSSRGNTLNCFISDNGGGSVPSNGTDSEVERRNQINNQLSNSAVSTIFRGRSNGIRGGSGTNAFGHNHSHYHNHNNHRSRTNPRSLDRRRIVGIPPSSLMHDQTYAGYAEPVFHEGILYDACLSHQLDDRNHLYPYIIPEFTTFRNLNGVDGNSGGCVGGSSNGQQSQHLLQPIYSRDSSFGSDSGYSHHTQTSSNRGGGNSSTGGGTSGCGWGRRKENSTKNNKNRTYEGS